LLHIWEKDSMTVMNENIFEVSGVWVSYGQIEVLRDINLYLKRGEIVALLGPNGAGKSTLMYSITGLVVPNKGRMTFEGRDIQGLSVEQIVKLGITLIPEGSLLFPSLKVKDNLYLGSYCLTGKERKKVLKECYDTVFQLFPILRDRSKQLAGTLSGGEQRMVALARGLMRKPRLLLLDEPSFGLAPLVVRELMETLTTLRAEHGLSLFLSEQNAMAALRIADRGYVMESGKIALEGTSGELCATDSIRSVYLGIVG
jgi:branched-chain amino acid transport system ATP-binding protein